MAAAGMDGIFTSDNQPQCFSAETNENCANCILMKEQLHSALLELQLAKTIISLFREDINKATAPEATLRGLYFMDRVDMNKLVVN
jgi:hypothetical protein